MIVLFVVLCLAHADTIVDGTDFPLTQAGVQEAMLYRAAHTGGIVKVYGDILVSGESLLIPAGVTLDCRLHSIKAHPTLLIPNTGLVRNVPGWMAPYNWWLQENALAGTTRIVIGPSAAAWYLPGDLMNVQQCQMPENPGSLAPYHTFEVRKVNGTSGVVTLWHPLPFDCLTPVAYVSRVRPTRRVGIRNCVLDAGGNAANEFSLSSFTQTVGFRARNLVFTGVLRGTAMAFSHSMSARSNYADFDTLDLVVSGGSRDLDFQSCEMCVASNIISYGAGGFGPRILQWHIGSVVTLAAIAHAVRGIRFDSCYFVEMVNVHSHGNQLQGSGTGTMGAFGSKDNSICNLMSTGNSGQGLAFSQAGDNRNQVYGFVGRANQGTDIGFSGAQGNFVQGVYDHTDGDAADTTNSNTLSRVGGTQGMTATTLFGPQPPGPADLRPYEVSQTLTPEGNLRWSMRESSGLVRSYVMTLS